MKLNFKELIKDKFVLGTFFLTAANFAGSFLNYLVHPILTRHLSVSAYGDFQALLSFSTVVGIIGAVISMALTKEFSVLALDRREVIKPLLRRALGYLSILGLVIFIVILFFSNSFNRLFNIPEPAILIISSLSLLYIFPLLVNKAVLSGLQRFPALSIINLTEPVFRLVLIILLVVIFPWGVNGAAWSLALTGLVAFLFSFWPIKKINLPDAAHEIKVSLRALAPYAALVLWFIVLTQFFYNFDMLLVKSSLDSETAGLYGALLTIGRIIYFIGGAVPLVMFPVVAGLKNDSSLRRYSVLGKSLGLMAVLAVPAYLFIALWPEFMVKIVVGAKYLSIASYLPSFALVMLLLTLVMVLANYFLALGNYYSLIILSFMAVLETVLLVFFANGLTEIILYLGLVFSLAVISLLFLALFEYNKTRRFLNKLS